MSCVFACRFDSAELALWALENGACINDRVKSSYCRNGIPLSWAASMGHNDVIRLLLSKGAKQHARRPHLPLESAVKGGYSSTVMLLIDDHIRESGGGSYDEFFNEEFSEHWVRLLLAKAAEHGHTNILQLFIELGFDLARFPEIGRSALYKASLNGHLSVIQKLVEMGVDVNSVSSAGSAVVAAEQDDRDDVVALLVQLGAKNPVEKRGDGSKVLDGKILHVNSRIRVWSAGKYIVDYKKW